MQQQLDVRSMLGDIRAPTLVMGRKECLWAPETQTRYVAEQIPVARYVQMPGTDLPPFFDAPELILDQIEEFITGKRVGLEPERSLLTVLFTDIVDSTILAAQMGDKKWRALLDNHDQLCHEQVALFGGKLVERTGDGTLATFERPSHAIECAQSLSGELARLNIRLRAGIHTAEVEHRDDGRIGGIHVHVAARVVSHAEADEVLVSHIVQGILLGTHYQFEERGIHILKGVPGQWPLFAVANMSK